MPLSSQTKKILLIAGFVIVVVGIGFAIYFTFFRQVFGPAGNENVNNADNANAANRLPNINENRAVNRNQNINVNGQTLPEISDVAKGGPTWVTEVTNQPVDQGAPASDGIGYVYYDPLTYKFYKVFPNGQRVEISSQEFYDVQNVSWSPDRNRAILNYPDGSNIYHDFQTGASVTLPKEMREPEFTKSGDKIAYKYVGDEDESWLAVASPNGSNQQIVESLGDRADRVEVNWSPDSQVVGVYRESIGINEEEIYFIGQHGENFKSFTVDGAGFTGSWSPDGNKLLYSVYNADSDYKPTLHVVDSRGDSIGLNNTDLEINTWPDKCAFGSGALYCAVPSALPDGAGMSRDLGLVTDDNIYEIDLETGQKTLLAIPYDPDSYGSYTVEKPYLSAGEDTLYFRSGRTGKLEQIRLK